MADSYVCTTAMMTCSFGVATCPLVVNPSRTVLLQGKQRANIGDFAPITNIASFGMCSSLINPTVASATAAAMGVLTPMPCVPAIVSPWMPGKPDLMVQGMPALTKSCTNMCMWQGQIKFVTDGQTPSPPPMTTPPPGKMSCVPSGKKSPLTQEEQANLSEEEREQYNKEMAQASKAGDTNQLSGDVWEKTADDYAQKGENEKAKMAHQMAVKEHNAAANKKNTAIGAVNEKFREDRVDKERKTLLREKAKEYVGKNVTEDDLNTICQTDAEKVKFISALKRERRDEARNFYRENNPNMSTRHIDSEINAIDLNKPIIIQTLPPPNQVYRYHDPEKPHMGGFACLKKEDGNIPIAEEIGVVPFIVRSDANRTIVDRKLSVFEITEGAKVVCLKSTAKPYYPAPADDDYSTPRFADNRLPTIGGAEQLRMGGNITGLFNCIESISDNERK